MIYPVFSSQSETHLQNDEQRNIITNAQRSNEERSEGIQHSAKNSSLFTLHSAFASSYSLVAKKVPIMNFHHTPHTFSPTRSKIKNTIYPSLQ